MTTITKFLPANISALGDRQVRTVCSAESVDRQGDIVVQAGIQLANFQKTGGVVLWNHDSSEPVGRALTIAVVDGKLTSLVQFAPEGASPKADSVFQLVKARIVNSASIGFRPIKSEPIDTRDPWAGTRYLTCELCEFSFVSVPAQVDATVLERGLSRSSGLSDVDRLMAIQDAFGKAKQAISRAKASHRKTEVHLSDMASALCDGAAHARAMLAAGFRPGDDDVDDNDELSMTPQARKQRLAQLDPLPRHYEVGLTQSVLEAELERLKRYFES